MKAAEHESRQRAPDDDVAAAEQELLSELMATEEAIRAADRASSTDQHPVIAAIMIVACLAFTAFNLTRATRADGDPGQRRSDAIEALELFAGDIEQYREETGTYPRAFDDPFEDDAWRYERITPDHFLLTVVQDGEELTYDSSGEVSYEEGGR